jgi:heptosyltransferase II
MIIAKLRNIFFALIASVLFIVRGAANKHVLDPKNILIIQMAKMGDMICTTPLMRAIKHAYPSARIYILGDSVNEELLKHNKDVYEYIVYNKEWLRTLRKISKISFDVGILTGPSPEMLALLYISGISFIISPVFVGKDKTPLRTLSYKWLSYFVKTVPHNLGNYAPREYLRLAEPLAVTTTDTKKHLDYSSGAKLYVEQFLNSRGIDPVKDFVVGISPSTGHKIKLWGYDKFAVVADYLYEAYGARIFLLGTKEERESVDFMIKFMSDKTPFVNALGVFDLDQLKALISQMKLFISVDTGPIYIAEAFGVATVDIVGPMNENDQPPVGEMHKVVVADRKKPEISVMNTRWYDEKEARRQSEAITPSMVIKSIDELATLLGITKMKV